MIKHVYLVLSLLKISKIVIYEFWYNNVKPKYGGKPKLCYTDADSFLVYIKREAIYLDIAKDVEARCDISNYELDWPLLKGKNENKVTGLMKYELGSKMMTEFPALNSQIYNYLTDDEDGNKKV